MGSAEWLDWRRRWRQRWVGRHGGEPACVVCGQTWTLTNGDLHHRSYDRLGAERWFDVIPLCRRCHDILHVIYESNPAWQRLGRARATDLIVAHLHRAALHRSALQVY
jgi:5-methylcytosine-specific restriction endonuclease McrA